MKKAIIPVAAFVAGLAIVPSVFAAGEATTLKLGDAADNTYANAVFDAATDLAAGDGWKNNAAATQTTTTIHPNGDDDKSVVELHYGTLKLTKTLECDADKSDECEADRPSGYSWLGVKVTKPSAGLEENQISTVKFNGGAAEAFLANDYTEWVGINEETLTNLAKKGTNPALIGTFEFDWDNNNSIDQTVRMYIDYTKVTLYDFTLDDEGEPNGIDIEAPAFSPAIAATIVPGSDTDEPTDEPADEGDKTENPNTADTIATYLTIATVALLGLGATAFVAKKSNR